jgi:hypothetical protein
MYNIFFILFLIIGGQQEFLNILEDIKSTDDSS